MKRVKFVLETKQGGSASQNESYHFVACLVELYQPTANAAGQRQRRGAICVVAIRSVE